MTFYDVCQQKEEEMIGQMQRKLICHGAVLFDICAEVGSSYCGGLKWSETRIREGKELEDRVC